jgi:rSAM/selenodomain-associated transferase 2
MQKFSIIIPTLNEEKFLPRVLTHLQKFSEEIEVIISDGGSTDDTIKIAEASGVKVCSGKKGRGTQMNKAVQSSNGEVLIFLHADTFLPDDALSLSNKLFFTDKIDIATFRMKFDSESFLMKIYSWFTRFDSIFTTFGDQVIIVRRSYFDEIGGFPNLPIMEDVEFLRRVRKTNAIYKLPSFATTSARRFEKRGNLKTLWLDGFYILSYLAGKSPDEIYQKYYDE